MINKENQYELVFVFFAQKEIIHFSEPIHKIQAQIEQDLVEDPNDIKKLTILAQIQLMYNLNENESLRLYKQVLQLDPTNIDARIDLGFILKQKKCFAKCNEMIDECYKLDPEYWRIYYLESQAYLISDNILQALQIMENAYSKFQTIPWISIYYAQQLADSKYDPEKLKNMIEDVTSKNKLDYQLSLSIAYIYGVIKNFDLQLFHLNNAIKLNPNSMRANFNLGCYYRDEKDYDKCIEYCQKVVKLVQNDLDSYSSLSYCYEQKHEYQKSYECLQKCFQINGEDIQTLQGLVYHCLMHFSDHVQTDLLINKILKRKPKNFYSLYTYLYLYDNELVEKQQDLEMVDQTSLQLLNLLLQEIDYEQSDVTYADISRLANKIYQTQQNDQN